MTLRLSYKLVWPEARLVVNESADWGEKGEINISPDNIVVWFSLYITIKTEISNIVVGFSFYHYLN